jgi:hypothetical protein
MNIKFLPEFEPDFKDLPGELQDKWYVESRTTGTIVYEGTLHECESYRLGLFIPDNFIVKPML